METELVETRGLGIPVVMTENAGGDFNHVLSGVSFDFLSLPVLVPA